MFHAEIESEVDDRDEEEIYKKIQTEHETHFRIFQNVKQFKNECFSLSALHAVFQHYF